MFESPGDSPDATETGRADGPSRRNILAGSSVRVPSPCVTKSLTANGAPGRNSPEEVRERRMSVLRHRQEGGGAVARLAAPRAPRAAPSAAAAGSGGLPPTRKPDRQRATAREPETRVRSRSRWRAGGLSPTRSRHCGFPVGSGLGGGAGRTGPRSICGYNDQRLGTRPSQRLYLEMGGSL